MPENVKAEINCDCGESFGNWVLGDDEAMMSYVDRINCAAGEHAGDWDVMDATVKLALAKGVQVGAHASFPDRQGFGRRKMVMPPASFRNCLAAQGGALLAICRFNGLEAFSHWKPHGQAYLMSADDIELARASAACAKLFDVPMVGLPGSAHEQAASEAGVKFIPEWYIDLQYDDAGSLAPPDRKTYQPASEQDVIARVTRLLTTREYATLSGKTLNWPAPTVSICVHGDLPGATGLAASVRKAIDALQ